MRPFLMKRGKIALLPVLVALVGAALVAYEMPLASSREVSAEGDTLLVHVQIYDLQGRLLYSSRVADMPALEEVNRSFDGPFMIPQLEEDRPMRLNVSHNLRPTPLDNTSAIILGDQLVGKPLGHRVALPVLGTFAGQTEQVVLERMRGPFNLTMRATNALLENTTVGEADGHIVFDDLLRARIVERADTWTMFRFDVERGDILSAAQTGFTAEVVDAGSPDQFRLYLHTEPGEEFTLAGGCEFASAVLLPGSYRVTAVDEKTITLDRAPTRWPQLIGRSVVMVVEIAQILDKEDG